MLSSTRFITLKSGAAIAPLVNIPTCNPAAVAVSRSDTKSARVNGSPPENVTVCTPKELYSMKMLRHVSKGSPSASSLQCWHITQRVVQRDERWTCTESGAGTSLNLLSSIQRKYLGIR